MDTLHDLLGERGVVRDVHHDEAQDECFINLCAFDNVLSQSAARFLSSPLGSRYRIGTFKGAAETPRTSGLLLRGFRYVDELEHAAHEATRALFGGKVSDLRPLSGVHATTSLILAATEPGDLIYSISPDHGGHFATRHIAARAGRISHYLAWDTDNHNFDIESIERQFAQHPPAYILLDHGTPLAPLKLAALRAAAGKQTLIDYDASHTLGLIAGGQFQNPLVEGCDILHGNTHKSFPGPQKALIVFNDEDVAQRVQGALDGGLVSSQHTHHLIALCVTLLEMRVWAKAYAQQMLSNAAALERALRQCGYIAPGVARTRSHVLLLDTPGQEAGHRWFEQLRQARISTNVRPLFGRTLMRMGVQEVTRRGFVEDDMEQIAGYLDTAISRPAALPQVRAAVIEKRLSRNDICYGFDRKEFVATGVARAIEVAA